MLLCIVSILAEAQAKPFVPSVLWFVLRSRSWRSSFVSSCVVCLTAAISFEITSCKWELMTARKEKDGRRRTGRGGCLVSYERKSFLPRQSLLTVERSGIVASLRKRTCGQDGGVEDVRQAFRQGCNGSTGRWCHRRPEGYLIPPHQVEERTQFMEIPDQNCRNCLKRSSDTRVHRRSRERSANLGEEGRLEEDG